MKRAWLGVLTFLALALAVPVAAQTPLRTTVTRDGAPAANVQIVLLMMDQPKTALGTTGTSGVADLVLGAANGGKPVRVQVVVYDCPNDQYVVMFVQAGASAPDETDCRKRILGWLWFGRARAVTIDVAAGTAHVQGQSFLSTTAGKVVLGAGAVSGVGIGLAAGGGSTTPANQPPTTQPPNTNPPTQPPSTPFAPSGNYQVTNSVASDPGNHRTFINMEPSTVLAVAVDGTTIRITCPPGSKWTLLTGTFSPSSGQITVEGRGQAASFPNVLFRFTGTIALSGSGQGEISGQLTIGAGNELPGGQPILFTVSGKKQ